MNQFFSNLANLFKNLHVSIPAILGALMAIAIIVWPQYSTKLAAVQGVLYA